MKKLPTLEIVHPPLGTARATYNRVNVQKADKQASVLAISERNRNNQFESGNVEENRLRVLKGLKPEPDVLPDAEQLRQLRGEIETINRALPGLYGEVQREIQVASHLLCQSVEGEHTTLVRDFFTKLSALHASHVAYVDFLNAVENTQASIGYFRPVSPNALGSPTDRSGAYHWAFKEFRENGHINHADIPKAIQ